MAESGDGGGRFISLIGSIQTHLFTGKYSATLDAKGRVIVPARIRDAVPKDEESLGVYLVRGPGRYVNLYTARRWEEIVGNMHKKAYSDRKFRDFVRLFFSSASSETWDRQGRIHLPEELRSLAGITKNLVFVGVNDRVEIWDVETWNEFEREKGTDFDRMADELSDQLF